MERRGRMKGRGEEGWKGQEEWRGEKGWKGEKNGECSFKGRGFSMSSWHPIFKNTVHEPFVGDPHTSTLFIITIYLWALWQLTRFNHSVCICSCSEFSWFIDSVCFVFQSICHVLSTIYSSMYYLLKKGIILGMCFFFTFIDLLCIYLFNNVFVYI